MSTGQHYIDKLHHDTAEELGYTREQLSQAMEALRESGEALARLSVFAPTGSSAKGIAEQALRHAEHVLASHAKRTSLAERTKGEPP